MLLGNLRWLLLQQTSLETPFRVQQLFSQLMGYEESDTIRMAFQELNEKILFFVLGVQKQNGHFSKKQEHLRTHKKCTFMFW